MRKIKLLITVLFLFSNYLLSQNYLKYYRLINKAEIAALDTNYYKSDSLYTIAFNVVTEPLKEDLFLAAKNAEKLGDFSLVNERLKYAVKKGLLKRRIDKEFRKFKKTKYWKEFEYNIYYNKYLNNIDLDLQNKVIAMINQDQFSRSRIFGSSRKSKKIDKENYQELMTIIKKYGKWPGFSLIGENTPKGKYDVTGNISLMLLHFEENEIDTLKPYMMDAVLNGEMYPYHYARIIDYTSSKITIKKDSLSGKNIIDQCFKYGTYLNENICDCGKAEEERKKIGFEPIEDYYRKRNSTYKCIEK